MLPSPPQPGFNPEMGDGIPQVLSSPLPIETTPLLDGNFDDLCFVGDCMLNLIKTGGISESSGQYLLDEAWGDSRKVAQLKERFTRPSGFPGINSTVIKG